MVVSARHRQGCESTVNPRFELLLQDSNLVYLIQSRGPRALNSDKLTGSGVPTCIGALSVFCEAADSVKPPVMLHRSLCRVVVALRREVPLSLLSALSVMSRCSSAHWGIRTGRWRHLTPGSP